MRDFLRANAQTPLSEEFYAAGLRLTIAANSESILKIARICLAPPRDSVLSCNHIHLRIWIDPCGESSSPMPRPYFRGLDHLIFIGLDSQSSFLIDLRTRQAIGRLTPQVAANTWLWKTVVFPVILTTFASAAGNPSVHSGCIAWKGCGVLLAGASRSGKSTLSLALARKGFDFVSDDRTVLTVQGSKVVAIGLSPYLKLRADSLAYFPPLNNVRPNYPFSHEDAIYLDPAEELGAQRSHQCEPRIIIWLEQVATPGFSIEELSFAEIICRLSAGLAQENPDAMRAQQRAIDSLADCECFLLRYGGTPQETAIELETFLKRQLAGGGTKRRKANVGLTESFHHRTDPLRRFTATPHCGDFRVMGRHLRVESNCMKVLEHTRQAFRGYPTATSTLPDFVWRIIRDPQSPLTPPWPEMSAFSHYNRRYINLGQKSFIAVDLDCREAVAHVSAGLIEDEVGFASIVLASMFYLCSGALGLAAISSACVASDGKGLLLFGDPHSGKTSSCFFARERGYDFHADQAVFVEMEGQKLKAWGDFWPAAFHKEASAFVPELPKFSRPFVHRAASYHCADKDCSTNAVATSVLPVACIFLERGKSDPPKLNPVSEREFSRLLEQAVPFTDLDASKEGLETVRRALLNLPAFRLQYDYLPSTPASYFQCLLSTHQVVECLG